MTLRSPSVFGGAIAGSISTSFWIAKRRQLKPPVPIRGPHHNDVHANIRQSVLDKRHGIERENALVKSMPRGLTKVR
jgi:hypothetical protein